MDAFSLHPSNYFRAADFAAPRQLTITGLSMEQMPDGARKPALAFAGEAQKLVLNKTNTQLLASLYGRETNSWAGRVVECYSDKVPMQGRIVDSIRLRSAPPPPAPVQAPQPKAEPQQLNWGQ